MTTRRLALLPAFVLIVVSVSISIWIVRRAGRLTPGETSDPEYERFAQLAGEGRTAEALELGDSLFKALLEEEPDNSVLAELARRQNAAEQIRALVTSGIGPDQPEFLEGVLGMEDLGLSPQMPETRAAPVSLLPPAREIYWTRLSTFTGKPDPNGLSAQQVAFCYRYHDLRMQRPIMQIGQQVLMSDPNSSENACYALVLPLLHLHGRGDDWEQAEPLLALFSPAMLDVLSRFALLQIERPEAAMAVAQYMAEATDKEFSPVQWALDAAEACVADHRPDLAERLLRTTVRRAEDRDSAAKLRLKIAEGYARCGDHETAAQICEHIVVDLPETSLYGRIKVARLGYLAREDKIEQVIAETGSALQEPGCKLHLAQILYLRWWALRKANRLEEALEIARVLVERCPTDPCVAPVLLARATDALARQEYDACRELLTRLTEDFPETESARRAADILSRLKGSVVE